VIFPNGTAHDDRTNGRPDYAERRMRVDRKIVGELVLDDLLLARPDLGERLPADSATWNW
jgi:hypothetical protein